MKTPINNKVDNNGWDYYRINSSKIVNKLDDTYLCICKNNFEGKYCEISSEKPCNGNGKLNSATGKISIDNIIFNINGFTDNKLPALLDANADNLPDASTNDIETGFVPNFTKNDITASSYVAQAPLQFIKIPSTPSELNTKDFTVSSKYSGSTGLTLKSGQSSLKAKAMPEVKPPPPQHTKTSA